MMPNLSVKAGARILGIGTDIVHLPRFSGLLQRYPLPSADAIGHGTFIKIAKKFMHPREISELRQLSPQNHSHQQTTTFIAGIWAVKESVLKAFSSFVPGPEMPTAQCIYTRLIYRDREGNGRPILRFDDNFPNTASLSELEFYNRYIKMPRTRPMVSISHDGDYLVTFVCLAEGRSS